MFAFISLGCGYAVGLVTATDHLFNAKVFEADNSLRVGITEHAAALDTTALRRALRRVHSSMRFRHRWCDHLLCRIRSDHFFGYFLPRP